MTAQPRLPSPMTLTAMQGYVGEIVAARGFTKDLNEIFILMVEEVGELAAELRNRVFYPERFDPHNLAHELADILLYLLDLANGFQVDLMGCWLDHARDNDLRFAERRTGRDSPVHLENGSSLNELQVYLDAKRRERGFEDSPEILLVLLSGEVGEIATEIRKSWKGMSSSSSAAYEIIDSMTYLLRIAHWFEVDIEAAVREKEERNAGRHWQY